MCQKLFQECIFTNGIYSYILYMKQQRYRGISNPSQIAQPTSAEAGFRTQTVHIPSCPHPHTNLFSGNTPTTTLDVSSGSIRTHVQFDKYKLHKTEMHQKSLLRHS